MAIEIQLNTMTIQAGDELYPVLLSSYLPCLPIKAALPKKYRRKRKRKTVASVIDSIIAEIEQGAQ